MNIIDASKSMSEDADDEVIVPTDKLKALLGMIVLDSMIEAAQNRQLELDEDDLGNDEDIPLPDFQEFMADQQMQNQMHEEAAAIPGPSLGEILAQALENSKAPDLSEDFEIGDVSFGDSLTNPPIPVDDLSLVAQQAIKEGREGWADDETVVVRLRSIEDARQFLPAELHESIPPSMVDQIEDEDGLLVAIKEVNRYPDRRQELEDKVEKAQQTLNEAIKEREDFLEGELIAQRLTNRYGIRPSAQARYADLNEQRIAILKDFEDNMRRIDNAQRDLL